MQGKISVMIGRSRRQQIGLWVSLLACSCSQFSTPFVASVDERRSALSASHGLVTDGARRAPFGVRVSRPTEGITAGTNCAEATSGRGLMLLFPGTFRRWWAIVILLEYSQQVIILIYSLVIRIDREKQTYQKVVSNGVVACERWLRRKKSLVGFHGYR
jgi:hypothetical protein